MAARDDRGMRTTGETGREGGRGVRLGDGGGDTAESFSCPTGSKCNR